MASTIHFPFTLHIPSEVMCVSQTLVSHGFESYLVGGCVRDILIGRTPKDWDITTDALPENLTDIFPHSHYDNTYGTVKVVTDSEEMSLNVIEVTTYRTESVYTDNRRPDAVSFSSNVLDDLRRRDFTINALAIPLHRLSVSHETCTEDAVSEYIISRETLIDEFHGIDDLENQIIRTVGNPRERFDEDALRLMRAIRFASQLSFVIDPETLESISLFSKRLETIAVERIQVELNSLLLSDNPSFGIELARRTHLLQYIIPELLEGYGMEQNQAHSFTVYEHLVRTLQCAADKKWPLHLRISAILHDISKPATREWSEVKEDWSFHGHEVLGSKLAKKILRRMKYPIEMVDKVERLVRWHMFFSDTETITLSAVRRLVRNVGEENIQDLLKLRIADRVGMGRPKEEPYRFRKYASMIEEALRSPTSVKMLAIDGSYLINEFHVKPGPIIGNVLNALLERVLENPELNTQEQLSALAQELLMLPSEELKKLALAGKQRIQEEEDLALSTIRSSFHVK